jgi:flavodoxin I
MEQSIGIFFGSMGGSTQAAAIAIANALGKERCKVRDICGCVPQDLLPYETLVLGTCTLGLGDIQDDWERFLRKLIGTDLAGKRVAFFGLGDQFVYSDTFVDAMGELHDAFVAAGGIPIGSWPLDGYEFDESKAVRGGRFVGLALDADNQAEQTTRRIARWVESLGI